MSALACCLALYTILSAPSSVLADPLEQAVNAELTTNKNAISSQKKIEALSEQTRKMLDEYRSATRQTETLHTYNRHLETLIASQQSEKASLQQQLEDIEVTQREIVPLILRMLENLETFISLDLPFLPEERSKRVEELKQMVLRADVTDAEKFRRILEAFQIENDYGNTIEAYRATLNLNGTEASVDMLRLGRIAMYYRRLDGSEAGQWNKETKRWETLPAEYGLSIRNGLRIAHKEAAPDLLTLPIIAAEAAK
ncbi:MAG: DUF3450 domain-containing protein [Gammaproteobacteria bacterium]